MKLFNHQRAFTLVEILVVTSIIVILTAAILVNYRQSGEQFALLRSAQKLAQDIRRAGEMAMSAKEFQGSIPQGGYGIYLTLASNTFYILYADKNGTEKYDAGDGLVETIYFEKGVYIKDISPSSLSVNFKPPNPTIKIKTEAGEDSANAFITLSLESDPAKTKIIRVNTAGLVDVE